MRAHLRVTGTDAATLQAAAERAAADFAGGAEHTVLIEDVFPEYPANAYEDGPVDLTRTTPSGYSGTALVHVREG